MVLAQNQNGDHWTKTQNPEINPHHCYHLMFDKCVVVFGWRDNYNCQSRITQKESQEDKLSTLG